MAILTNNLGFPRIGARRELKKATESYWAGKISEPQLKSVAAQLRAENWKRQQASGIDLIPSNDFSLYDHMLDMSLLVGALPPEILRSSSASDLSTYFALARGTADSHHCVMEMTKWFDTNYHYLVPELVPNQEFTIRSTKPFDEFREAQSLGIKTKPVLVGPITFLLLSKMRGNKNHDAQLSLLDQLLPVYIAVLRHLHSLGAEWVQLDEPILCHDVDLNVLREFDRAYKLIRTSVEGLKLMVATYFGPLGGSLPTLLNAPVDAVHLDLTRNQGELLQSLDRLPERLIISAGIVDGRNVWLNNLNNSMEVLGRLKDKLGPERLMVAPSCSLIHAPLTTENENKLDPAIKSWLSFSAQKLDEVRILADALGGAKSAKSKLSENADVCASRAADARVTIEAVRKRISDMRQKFSNRKSGAEKRKQIQQERHRLPLLPTTTIGSFPQTVEVRKICAAWKKGDITDSQYNHAMEERIKEAIAFQEELGLDVFVHGEFERNDMVEYFAEFLNGVAFTESGWVQSFGTRYVKPPVIYGDISRKGSMTVRWSKYAQSLTKKPVKGMLTGPVTMLQWSFVRDDQPRQDTCLQLAAALQDEVTDLEREGISIIQIDEPAFREGLPLKSSAHPEYIRWASQCFRLVSVNVSDETQIHTHMCYAEFDDFIQPIADLDADVISLEAARSNMSLLDCFQKFRYPNDVGPGIWDIHSPHVPPVEEMERLLTRATYCLSDSQIWVNPDCGLKTRSWEEVRSALKNMVEAAQRVRQSKSAAVAAER